MFHLVQLSGVGVGNTVVYTYKVSGNGISSTFVPTQQIFLQEHGFKQVKNFYIQMVMEHH